MSVPKASCAPPITAKPLPGLAPNMTLEELYRKHNADTRPFYRQMRSLSESDVIVVKRGGERKAYYVDIVGFQEVPSFLKGLQKLKERGKAR